MNTANYNLLPLAAAALFALCAGSMVVSANQAHRDAATTVQAATDADAIPTLATVTVKPEAEDLAHYLAYRDVKTVDLATITVHPEADDLAAYLSSRTARIVDFPTMTVRATADMQQVAQHAGAIATQLAAR